MDIGTQRRVIVVEPLRLDDPPEPEAGPVAGPGEPVASPGTDRTPAPTAARRLEGAS